MHASLLIEFYIFYLHKKIEIAIEDFFMLDIELVAKDIRGILEALEPERFNTFNN